MTIAPERTRTVHDLRVQDTDWDRRALCATRVNGKFVYTLSDWDLASREADGTSGRNARAVTVCQACPVQRDCLIVAAQEGDEYAIRGGLTPRERDAWLAEQGISPARAAHKVDPGAKPKPRLQPASVAQECGPGKRRHDMDSAVLLQMHTEHGWSFRQIAEHYGCSLSTVQGRVKAARKAGAA